MLALCTFLLAVLFSVATNHRDDLAYSSLSDELELLLGRPRTLQSDNDNSNKASTIAGSGGSSSSSSRRSGLLDNLLRNNVYITDVWQGLIDEAAELQKQQKDVGIIMEVGMHRAVQCLQAAKAGLQAHCVEPSPQSFQRVQNAVQRAPAHVQGRVHLYNVAAGGTSEGTVPFKATGGTGDHVGAHNMWKMELEETIPEDDPNAKIIQVPSMRLDDIVHQTGDSVFLLKVDTQGFEPTVFSGLTDSLKEHKVQYILFEYWPRGMDLLADRKDACIAANLLQELVDKGYTLHALGVEAHPKAPKGWRRVIKERPLLNFEENCRWYFQVEEQFPSDEYKMGYWSDVLAVAPNAPLSDAPATKVGRALRE